MGTPDQLCEGLFHVFPIKELRFKGHGCINGQKHDICRPHAMTMIVRTNKNFVGRYTNCKTVHAEQIWTQSTLFSEHLKHTRPTAVYLFMKYHPCHHSGGNARRYPEGYMFGGNTDSRSCTNLVIDFFKRVLQPQNVTLHIHVASLFKASWQFATREDDKKTSENSLLGLRLLLEAGIEVDCMYMHHWLQLANLCESPIQLENILTEKRLGADAFVHDFINKQRAIADD